jgi:ligand-binding sensor domain-containing protein/serine phosphatase RsbU (regulator of sigma subunit)
MKKLLAFCFFILSYCAFPQEYRFNVIGQEEGLPQPYVYDLVQDRKGFLWIATGDGLAKYSGKDMRRYTVNDSLSENYCNALFLDSKNTLWIGHFEGGITYFKNGKFNKLKTDQFPLAKVVSITEDASGTIYYASSAGSIYTIKDNKIEVFIEEELAPVSKIKIVGNYLYAASQSGLVAFDLNKRAKEYKIIPETEDKTVTSFEIKSSGNFWIGLSGEGVLLMQGIGSNLKLKKQFKKELESKELNVKDVCVKGENELWVSLTGEGVRMLRLTNNQAIERELKINDKNGLGSLFIQKLFVDAEGSIWLGSVGSGLFQFQSGRFEFFNTNNILPFNDVRAICANDSNYVFVCDQTQLFVLNQQKKYSQLFTLFKSGSGEEIRTSIYDRSKKEILLGTNKGLYVFEFNKDKITALKPISALNGKSINQVNIKKSGEYYVGTIEGLFILDDKKNLLKYFSTDVGLPHNNINGLLIDKKQKIWVFSPESPLYQIDDENITLVRSSSDSVTSNKFVAASQDDDENIWFATDGNGLFFCDKFNYERLENFKHYGVKDGLLSDFIYSIVISDKGDVLACHRNGISIKYRNIKNFRKINKASGFPANNINTNTRYKDAFGNIWFGSLEGLIKYYPEDDRINYQPPTVSFLRVEMNDSIYNLTDTLYNLPAGDYKLIVNFIGTSLMNPEGVTYRYQLVGMDDDWRKTDNGEVLYPKLSEGLYQFKVYASNADGIETQLPATFSIFIDKPIYKKVWFIVLATLILGGIVYLAFWIRIVRLRKAKIELENQVKLKTKELSDEKDRVEEANEMLAEKNRDITSSISYAKRIQGAFLPDEQIIKKRLDFFVLYKPRDIVSGDFYWFSETEEYTYLAVVDCTGHGVPGAFMSLLGSTFLDQALIENRDGTPAVLLNDLDKRLANAFKSREEENRIGDGMDAIILRIDKQKTELLFAGANRPLYYYPAEGEFIDYKSPIYSVGGAFGNEVKGFHDSRIEIKKGDAAYMFSDGFGDQFGGPKSKRYSTKRMKSFFASISQLDSKEQFIRVDQEFETWKGEEEQMDDICVVGVKF